MSSVGQGHGKAENSLCAVLHGWSALFEDWTSTHALWIFWAVPGIKRRGLTRHAHCCQAYNICLDLVVVVSKVTAMNDVSFPGPLFLPFSVVQKWKGRSFSKLQVISGTLCASFLQTVGISGRDPEMTLGQPVSSVLFLANPVTRFRRYTKSTRLYKMIEVGDIVLEEKGFLQFQWYSGFRH